MTILAIGDSFTFGAELNDCPGPEELSINCRQYWNPERTHMLEAKPSQFAWPALLSQRLNTDLVNLGLIGGSNDRIFRLAVTESSKKHYDLVICAWTSVNRLDISYQGEECPVTANVPVWPWVKSYYADHYDQNRVTEKWLSQLLTLQSYFKIHNQKYIFVNAVKNIIFSDYDYLKKQIDFTHYIDYEHSFQDWCNDLPRGPGGHFLEQGHQLVSDRLFEFVKNNNLL